MMASRERDSVSRRSRRLAAVGSYLGLGIALVLTALLIRVHVVEGTHGSPAFGLIYSAILLAPFIVSYAALMKGGARLQVNSWGVSGLAALLVAVVSVSFVALPLLIPAVLLIAAAVTGDPDR